MKQPVLQSLLTRLKPEQRSRISNALIATLETTTDLNTHRGQLFELTEMVPWLERTQVIRAWNLLGTNLSERSSWPALAKLMPRLETPIRDDSAMHVTTILLDYSCCGSEDDHLLEQFLPLISSAKSLATLLSHPGCVGEERDALLRRFEEIVLYDGKAVFPNPRISGEVNGTGEVAAKQPPKAQTPQRQFHTLADAADWIGQNWPDFDLEVNCPATWRPSHVSSGTGMF